MSRTKATQLAAFLLAFCSFAFAAPVLAEGEPNPAPAQALSPADAAGGTAVASAPADSAAGQLPIELAPVKLPERRSASEVFQGFQRGILYNLPSRMFMNSSVENSVRLETNVYQKLHHNRADFIYRPAPSVTLGYALTRKTRVAANYFFIRDQYTRNDTPLSRNINSVGMRLDQDIRLTEKTTATVGIMDRWLFVSHSRWFNDVLPSLSVTRPVGYRGFIYGSVIGQLRWYDEFKTMQEGDVFYSFGGVYRRGPWVLSSDTTFLSNFRKRKPAGPNSEMFILTLEAARRINPRLPLPLYAFVRAQPIFNIGANQATGFAGYNFRLYGGLRLEMNKPAIFPVKLARL